MSEEQQCNDECLEGLPSTAGPSYGKGDVVVEGNLKKIGGGPFSSLQERYFLLVGTSLEYYAGAKSKDGCSSGNYKGTIDIKGAQVIDRGTYKKHQCFTIEGENLAKGVKEYFLFCDTKETKWMWLSAIMAASGRYTFLNAGQGVNMERLKSSPLFSLMEKNESNRSCADCGNPNPTWCVLRDGGGEEAEQQKADEAGGEEGASSATAGAEDNTLSVKSNFFGFGKSKFCAFVCIECIGLHRKLWAPSCKEAQLDKWSPEEIRRMEEAGGNAAVNEQLEFHVPEDIKKPVPTSDAVLREAYIRAKWKDMKFLKSDEEGSPNAVAKGPLNDDSPAPKPEESRAKQFGQPPKYIGIVFAILLKADDFVINDCVACITNGFQEVRSQPGKKGDGVTQWGNPLQIGIDTLQRPLYITYYDKSDKIVGTSELLLGSFEGKELNDEMLIIPITGKGTDPKARATLSINFNQLT